MFEVIICTVHTGRVTRKSFPTRAKADRYVEQWEKRTLRPRYDGHSPSLRSYRVEVRHQPEQPTPALTTTSPEPAVAA
jgi:hypothetical protein